MNRWWLALVPLAIAAVVAIGIFLAYPADGGRNGDKSAVEATPTSLLSIRDVTNATPDATLPPATPTLPDDLPDDAVLMFCEPVTSEGEPGTVAQMSSEYEVVYEPNSCQAEFDAQGAVLVRDSNGNEHHVAPEYVERPLMMDWIVWKPATGKLDGADTIMTASSSAMMQRLSSKHSSGLGSSSLTRQRTALPCWNQ